MNKNVLFIAGIIILALVGVMLWIILSPQNAQTVPTSTPGSSDTPTGTATSTATASLTPTVTATDTPTSIQQPTARPAGNGDAMTYEQVVIQPVFLVESLTLVKKDVLLPDPSGYRPDPGGNMVGLMTVRLTNPRSAPFTVHLADSDLVLDNSLATISSVKLAGGTTITSGGVDEQGYLRLDPGNTVRVNVWFSLQADWLPGHFTWLVYCPLELRADSRLPDRVFPQCIAGGLETTLLKQDLGGRPQRVPDLAALAGAGYPQEWPEMIQTQPLPTNDNLPACAGDQFAQIQQAVADLRGDPYYNGVAYTGGVIGDQNLLQFFAITSGETTTTTIQRAGLAYTIHLARVYFLSKANKGELHSTWLAYGYDDPALGNFGIFRGDAFSWDRETADTTMSTPGQTLFVYSAGNNSHQDTLDLFQCPSAGSTYYITNQVGCSLALRLEYTTGGAGTDRFITDQSLTAGWYPINWSINILGQVSIPSGLACR